jgi:undecaprenyl-diphosphatase
MHFLFLCRFLAISSLTFDRAIISWTNHFAGYSWIFDYTVYHISDNNLLKGGLFLTVLYGFWFRRGADKPRDHKLVVSILAGCVIALTVNKILQVAAPHRTRPYLAHLPDVTFPYDLGMVKISSFPSDHASLFFALSTGLCFFSIRAGLFAYLYTIIVICLPRIYLGLHYPSDLLAGAFIGTGSAWLACGTRLREMTGRPALAWSEKYPGLFHAALFLFTYQLATLFDDIRAMGGLLHTIAPHIFTP